MPQFEIRACRPDDLPEVVDLLLRGGRAADGVTVEQIRDYARRVYFENPWVREDIPSLVSVDMRGRIEGFAGVIPRTMKYKGERISVAVPGNFVVRANEEGKTNAMAAIALMKRFSSGPQDISISDTANDLSRRLWESVGSIAPAAYSLEWFRPIAPATAIMKMMENVRRRPMPFARAMRLSAATADLLGKPLLARMVKNKQLPFATEAMTADSLLEVLESRDRHHDIRGDYTPEMVGWLLDRIEEKARAQTVRRAIVLDDLGRRVGAYIYRLYADGVAEVLLAVAREGKYDTVFNALVGDATGMKATVVTGTVQPRYLPTYRAHRCLMLCNQWTLVHSRRPELLDAFSRGRALFTTLDGERWTHFDDMFAI